MRKNNSQNESENNKPKNHFTSLNEEILYHQNQNLFQTVSKLRQEEFRTKNKELSESNSVAEHHVARILKFLLGSLAHHQESSQSSEDLQIIRVKEQINELVFRLLSNDTPLTESLQNKITEFISGSIVIIERGLKSKLLSEQKNPLGKCNLPVRFMIYNF